MSKEGFFEIGLNFGDMTISSALVRLLAAADGYPPGQGPDPAPGCDLGPVKSK